MENRKMLAGVLGEAGGQEDAGLHHFKKVPGEAGGGLLRPPRDM